ncbi:hypothetical protein KXD40_003822 [Peronospora effusa]|uniref:Uncharacterized protein n=1 Tax=Peronospora effusa TaxID=542832 RepID=A0A3M6VTD7_9STRA|nr:hypothetical protein DD238_000667 [Peronospora effusa]RQM17273.1 hypothetical protein DD237_000726 [Peronospora effusa]UIZ22737.1 hypothetical protein KXD40_003822 [Peronospora effusa]
MSRPRQVIVDDQVAAFLSCNVKSAFGLGLLVGQVSFSNVGDFVLAVVPIPSENESNDTPTGLDDVSVDWVQEVAQQVDHLLPGGITILGLYVVSTLNVSTQIVPFLRAVAEAVTLPSNVIVEEANVHYLAFVSSNSDIAFQSFYDVTDVNKMQMLSAELKSPTTDIQFKQYRTLIDLDEPTSFVSVSPRGTISATEVAEKRMNEVENQLKPLFRRVQDSIAVLKLTGDTEVQHMNLLTLTPPKEKTFVKAPLGGIRGGISCVAFVSESEPKANEVAATYLKRDFMKSLLVRLSLARERWAEDDEVEPNAVFQKGGVIRLAQRGLVQWRSATVLSRHFFGTVHVFPDDDAVQAVKNALEILGNDATNDGTSWAAMEIGGQLGSPMDLTFCGKESEYFKYMYYLLPVVIVLVLLVVQNLV